MQFCGNQYKCSLIDTYRLDTLAQQLPRPEQQQPSIVYFIGQDVKDAALPYIFPYNTIRKCRPYGIARLRVDNSSTSQKHPVFFADTDLTLEVRTFPQNVVCHQEKAIPVQWASADIQGIFDQVFTRALLASSTALVLFVDDFVDLNAVAQSLTRWISIGLRSDAPMNARPRLLLVVKGNHYGRQDIRTLYTNILALTEKPLTTLFSLVTTVYLEEDAEVPASLFQPLRVEIFRQLDDLRKALSSANWSFNAKHLSALHKLHMRTVAASLSSNLAVFKAFRTDPPHAQSYGRHLGEVITFGRRESITPESTTSFIASAILMDAYPPRAHCMSIPA